MENYGVAFCDDIRFIERVFLSATAIVWNVVMSLNFALVDVVVVVVVVVDREIFSFNSSLSPK